MIRIYVGLINNETIVAIFDSIFFDWTMSLKYNANTFFCAGKITIILLVLVLINISVIENISDLQVPSVTYNNYIEFAIVPVIKTVGLT